MLQTREYAKRDQMIKINITITQKEPNNITVHNPLTNNNTPRTVLKSTFENNNKKKRYSEIDDGPFVITPQCYLYIRRLHKITIGKLIFKNLRSEASSVLVYIFRTNCLLTNY